MKYDEKYPKALVGRSYGEPPVTKIYQIMKCEICEERTKWKDSILDAIVCSEECHKEWILSLEEVFEETDDSWDDLLGL